jgi:arylsulfatase A-like enzyme
MPAAEKQPPNILFIFADDHTTQALSAYGHPLRLVETPNMDRLAKEGMLFRALPGAQLDLRSQPGRDLDGQVQPSERILPQRQPLRRLQQTFPKLLQQAGYQTAVIGKWHLATDPTGFDHWHILPGQGIYYNPPMIRDGQQVKHEGYTTDLIADFSIEWLKSATGRNRFC